MFKTNARLFTLRVGDRKLLAITLKTLFIWHWNIHRGWLGTEDCSHYTNKALPLGFYATYRKY